MLPTVSNTIRVVKRGDYITDQDIGEMSLNFILCEEVITFFGVYVSSNRT